MILMFAFDKKFLLQILAISIFSFSLSSCEQIKERIGLGGPKDIPLGEYIGEAKLMSTDDKEQVVQEVKISFLPKEPGFKDAIGVVVFNNSSDRFLWRSDGNNSNIWNIMFSKDNTLYSSLEDSFEYSGIIKASSLRNTLEGKLTKIVDGKEIIYYITAAQVFKPELVRPEAPLVVKPGEEVIINASKLDPDKTKVLLTALEGEAETQVMTITNSIEEKGVFSLTFATSKDLSKGKYRVNLERDDGQKSKAITIEIK